MTINFDKFRAWAESRFDDVIVSGNEIKLNSIFTEDYKHHLWCNPYGGKKERDHGVYHCWKTGNKGSLASLVMKIDGCEYDEALSILDGNPSISLRDLELEVQAMFDNQNVVTTPVIEEPIQTLKLPEHTYLITDLPSCNYHRTMAEEYLKNRKLPIDYLMVCTDGQYRNRIVIPYYDVKGVLIYFNSRDITGKSPIRYMGPPKEIDGVKSAGKGDVVYVPRWPMVGSKIYITEGEFDAISLCVAGFPAGAIGGKNINEKQIYMFEDQGYEPILCFDNDKAGKSALLDLGRSWIGKAGRSQKQMGYLRPPKNYKDWNQMLVSAGENVMGLYINKCTKPFDSWTADMLEFRQL